MPDEIPDLRSIPLSRGQFALVDAADYEWLMQWKWAAAKFRNTSASTYYAIRSLPEVNGKKATISMHRQIMEITSRRVQVDHRDGNGLHNWRGNLRASTHSQNQWNRPKYSNNTSGFKGVCWIKTRQLWRTRLKIHGITRYCQYFNTAEEAARAYDIAALELHGEFARLNFPIRSDECEAR